MSLRGAGTTTRMLKEALRLVPSTGKGMPLVIVGRNPSHLRTLMEMFGKLAWDAGYHIKATSRYSFLVDHEARVEFKLPQQLDRMVGMHFIEIFVYHYVDECLPSDKRLEFVQPADSVTPVLELSWQL